MILAEGSLTIEPGGAITANGTNGGQETSSGFSDGGGAGGIIILASKTSVANDGTLTADGGSGEGRRPLRPHRPPLRSPQRPPELRPAPELETPGRGTGRRRSAAGIRIPTGPAVAVELAVGTAETARILSTSLPKADPMEMCLRPR